ncbi:hypothetical protein [Shinella sp.]|uniref:hypothetical protein n=1 Tax=Shinella sp. TaxID=1870904 RepID=UPI003F72D168
MNRSTIIATLVALAALPAFAQDVNPLEGLWSGKGEGDLTVDLKHVQDDIYKISIETVVPMQEDGLPGCGGGIEGEVKLDRAGGNFFVENEAYDPNAEQSGVNARYCEIGLVFSKDGKLLIEERSGCLSYHGAACGFTGELVHDAAGL